LHAETLAVNARLASSVLTALSIACIATLLGCSESQRKSDWAFLQRTEFQFREKPVVEIMFHSEGEYHAVGIRSQQSGTNVWILLNPKTTPLYKQLPQGQFSITEVELQKIAGSGNVNETVLACLASHETGQSTNLNGNGR
jgi:hypothetical protein